MGAKGGRYRRYFLNKKGTALLMVLATLLVVVALANVILLIISSQSRLTHHQISRIQAYYAAQAGMNYALEQLRTGSWTAGSCPSPAGCNLPNDPSFSANITQPVIIIFCPSGVYCASLTTPCTPPTGIDFCIDVKVDYTS